MFELATLREINAEPRILDVLVAERLGYERPRKIRELIRRYRDELEGCGVVCTTLAGGRPKWGAETIEYWLNEPQAVLVCLLSRAPKAAEVRQAVMQVFMGWRQGLFGGEVPRASHLTRAQRSAINRQAWRQTREFYHRRRDELRSEALRDLRGNPWLLK